MNRRVLLVAIAAALTVSASAAHAQEPIVFGVITPLSPPGETSLGQQVKRGSEIAVEYLNEKGGVLGRKVVLSIHDTRRQERGRRRGLSAPGLEREGGRGVRLHPQRRQHRGQRGRQGDGRPDHGHPDRRRRRDGQALRHRVPHPCGRSAARRHLARLGQEERLQAPLDPGRDDRLRHRPGQGDRGAEQEHEHRPGDPDHHVRPHDDRSPAAAPAGEGVQARRHRQCRRRSAARPDDHPGDHGRPAADRPDGHVVRCAGPSAALAAAQGAGRRRALHRVLYAEIEAQRPRRVVREEVPGEVQRAADLFGAERLRQRGRVRAGDRDGQDHRAEGVDQGARDRLVQGLVVGAGDVPAGRGRAVAQLVAAADDPEIHQGRTRPRRMPRSPTRSESYRARA